MFSPTLRRTLQVIFTPLYVNAVAIWLVNVTFLFKDVWKCQPCRTDEHPEPSVAPHFLFFSVWNGLLALIVFFHWAYFLYRPHHHVDHSDKSHQGNHDETDNSDDITEQNIERQHNHEDSTLLSAVLFPTALPFVTTVFAGYLVYVVDNPVDSFIDEEICDRFVRSEISKDISESHPFAANLYMFLHFLMDCTIHYLSAPLLISFYVYGEIPYKSMLLRPVSPIFTLILGVFLGVVHETVAPVYCTDNIWVSVIGTVGVVTVFHVVYVLGSQGRLCKTWKCVLQSNTTSTNATKTQHEDDEEEEDRLSDE